MSGRHYAEDRPSKLVCGEEEPRNTKPADFDWAEETRLNTAVHRKVSEEHANFSYWSGIIPRRDAYGKRI